MQVLAFSAVAAATVFAVESPWSWKGEGLKEVGCQGFGVKGFGLVCCPRRARLLRRLVSVLPSFGGQESRASRGLRSIRCLVLKVSRYGVLKDITGRGC